MSYDASSLRGYLQRIDGSAPAIQGAAGAMMKHYDRSAGVAVGEWRNALIQAKGDQYLPLLYVANEVLQTSKRNRGNKFLEAFSPVLGQSLIFVCGKSQPNVVESIRRTVKIWAERRVFSIRYVNELIKGLEPYRTGNRQSANTGSSSSHRSSGRRETEGNQSPGGSRFSPVEEPPANNKDNDSDSEMGRHKEDHKDNGGDDDSDDDDDDDDDDLFGNDGKKILDIAIDFDRASTAISKGGGSAKKRRRSSTEPVADLDIATVGTGTSTSTTKSSKPKRRASSQFLSASSLMELMNQVTAQQTKYDRVMAKLKDFHQVYGESDAAAADNNNIDTLVGEELLQEYKNTLQHEHEIDRYRRELHSIAQTRRALEVEALRYLPWLERALKQDQDDIDFCQTFRKQLDLFRTVHKPTKEARERRLHQEALRLQKEEALRKKQRDEEDRKKFMESAMAKQTEAQPGMVWNRATGEYQHLNQEESWRD